MTKSNKDLRALALEILDIALGNDKFEDKLEMIEEAIENEIKDIKARAYLEQVPPWQEGGHCGVSKLHFPMDSHIPTARGY